jgi:hypothetical protein
MESLNPTEWEVLNATADDPENLERIFRMLRDSSPSITLSEVADAVHTLVEKGLLAARGEAGGQPLPLTSDLGYVWRAWFAMTPRGREAWVAHAPEKSSATTIPSGRFHFGAWKDIAVDIPLEDFQEAGHEMSRNFPREFPESTTPSLKGGA